ncbi:MAG TPA: SpoIIE family protein phosphatase, partial [Candidatus Methylomirabilis sp.]|nr:SpoIIE family protein phosphatase [Candidatus Methylomirabilis sp.]
FDPEGGVVRRLPLLAAVQGTLAPSLGLEMLRVASGEPALSVRADQGGIVAVGVGDVVIPTEGDGSVWIHYSRSDPDRFVSAVDVLSGKIEASRFARTLVLIAVTAVGLSDFQATPVADRMPGAEIHAQLLEGIVDGDLLSRPRWALAVEAALLVGLGLLLILVIPSRSVKISTVLLLLGMGAVVALGFLGYLRFRVLFDAATPAIGLAVLFSGMLGVTLAEADIQRRALRREVARQREAALKLAGELEAARRIQMGILPAPAAAFPGERRFDLFAFLEPARQVGGDLYDFFRLEGGRVFVLIGDVSGKGLPSSLFMALAKSFCKSIALRRTGDVGAVIREADAEISRDNAESLFVTVFAAVLDPRSGELQYCNAGHDPPYVLPVAGGLGRLDGPGGPPLCAVSDFPYAAVEHRLRPGDRVCFITDGVVDAENATGEFYGRKRLESLLGGLAPDAGAEEVGAAIRDDVGRFAAGVEASDDLAIVVLRWTPEAAGPG